MEKQTKFNIASSGLIILSIIIVSITKDLRLEKLMPRILFEIIFFAPVVLLLISLILSIICLKIKRNSISVILIYLVIILYLPLCYMPIIVFIWGITCYHG